MASTNSCNFHIVLQDGATLSYPEEVLDYLYGMGFTQDNLRSVFSAMFPEISGAYDKADYYERLADGYFVASGHFIDEVEAVVGKLKSGRSGKGYTKFDIAKQLEYIIDTCDPREGA